jgi:hypothetical protein
MQRQGGVACSRQHNRMDRRRIHIFGQGISSKRRVGTLSKQKAHVEKSNEFSRGGQRRLMNVIKSNYDSLQKWQMHSFKYTKRREANLRTMLWKGLYTRPFVHGPLQ